MRRSEKIKMKNKRGEDFQIKRGLE